MTTGRDIVLSRIRQALAKTAPLPPAETSFRRHADGDRPALIEEFIARAAGYKVRVERVSPEGVRSAAERLLGERGHRRIAIPVDLPEELRPHGVELLADEDLDNATIAACDGVMTGCACAIAQTGTVVLDHGAGQGRRKLTLLPDYHLCVVLASRLVGLVPEAVERMAGAVRAGRPLTFVSGPSATSDIELIRVEGVHGPRTLNILLVDD